MFRRLDKLDGSIFREAYILGRGGEAGYIWNVNWVAYLVTYFVGVIYRGRINRFLQYFYRIQFLSGQHFEEITPSKEPFFCQTKNYSEELHVYCN